MIKFIKKLSIGCALVIACSSHAATVASLQFTNSVFTNFPGLSARPVRVTQIILSNPTSNEENIVMYDIPNNSLTYSNAPYTNTVSYLSNVVTTLTNYYGAVASLTNVMLFDNTNNAVLGATNNVPPKLLITVPANSSFRVDSVNYYFYQGVWITNSTAYGAGTNGQLGITLTYQ